MIRERTNTSEPIGFDELVSHKSVHIETTGSESIRVRSSPDPWSYAVTFPLRIHVTSVNDLSRARSSIG